MSGDGKTLKDVAEKLGVSIATVSRALAGQERISTETRLKVAKAAEDIGYTPNRAARALVSGRTGFVGLLLPMRGHGQADPFVGELVTGLCAGLTKNGMDLFLSVVPPERSEFDTVRDIVKNRRADGLALARIAEDDPRVDYLIENRFPFVAHGRLKDTERGYDWLDTDGQAAFGEAFDLLYGLGHRRFGFVTISDPMTFRLSRAEGLHTAIEKTADPSVGLSVCSAPRFDKALRSREIHKMLTSENRPTAVVALFDGLAISVLQEAESLGLRVPEDLSIIGFDNIPAAEHVPPGLTTFDAEIERCAYSMAEMLARRITDGSGAEQTRLVRPKLIERGSHGPAPERLQP